MPDDDLIDRATEYRLRSELTHGASLALIRELRDALVAAHADNERLRSSEWAARGERDSMKRRLELLAADESWWIGGAWGEYGEAVVPLRAIWMVLGEKGVDQSKVGEPELNPGLAATYRDLRATVEHLAADNERLRADLTDVAHQIEMRAHESAVMAKSGSYDAGREEAWRASFLSIEQALRGNWPHPDGAR